MRLRFSDFFIQKIRIVTCGIFGICTLLSLASYHCDDRSFNVFNERPVRNILGKIGAFYSDILIQFFGHGSYLLAILPIFWCCCALVKNFSLFGKRVRYCSLLTLILTSCVLLEGVKKLTGAMSGGVVGSYFFPHTKGPTKWSVLCILFLLNLFLSFNFRKTVLLNFFSFSRFNLFQRKKNFAKQNFSKTGKKLGSLPNMDKSEEFKMPSTELLAHHKNKTKSLSQDQLRKDADQLLKVLEDFGVKGQILNIKQGPVVTLHEFEPAAGIKASRVIGLADDIARSLGAESARISSIPGRKVIGIEIPNSERAFFGLRELIESEEYRNNDFALPIILGKALDGEPCIVDLAKMPHLLIAGTTGSGKSVSINTLILSLLYRYAPEHCKLIMIDPKMLELSVYADIPHLLTPVVVEPNKAVAALKWTVKEMEKRYKLMSALGVRGITSYNIKCEEAKKLGSNLEKKVQTGFDPDSGLPKYETITAHPTKLPFLVVIVDEMADLMLVAGREIETSIQRLAQMARASGIHLIMATQRPSVDVITGVIKANFPSRISFKVTSKIDSRTILGDVGAEQLLGSGDMLYMGSGAKILRAHGPFVGDKEIEDIVSYLKTQASPDYVTEVTTIADSDDENGFENLTNSEKKSNTSDLYKKAVEIVTRDNKASISYIQRRLNIGYNKAASLIEKMETEGVVSSPNPSGKREILN
jgi:S-DNA-T family DNA segregation ATPase FtsK/SpoIIIE